MFLHLSVSHSLHRGEGVSLTETPPLDKDPPGQRIPLDRDTPRTVKSGWYASYWNEFLFNLKMVQGRGHQNFQLLFITA